MSAILDKEINLFGPEVNDRSRERFYSDLGMLLTSGVDIKSALEIIVQEQTGRREKDIFTAIKEKVIKGAALSSALETSGKFSSYEYFSIRIGEESGRLHDVLSELASFYARRINQKRQIISALSYPSIVIVAAFAAIFFMLNFVVPMFSDVFKRFGGELPWLTRFIINASAITSALFPYFILISVAFTVFLISQRRAEWFKRVSSQVMIKMPVMGIIIKKIYLGRFCSSMHLLAGANMPLVSALDMIEKMVSFYPIEQSLREAKAKVIKGSSLHEALSPYSIYDRRMLSLIKVAEEVNRLDVVFKKLAKQYSDDVEYRTGILGTTLEPALIVFIGLFVGVVLIAMYLPLFQLGTVFGR